MLEQLLGEADGTSLSSAGPPRAGKAGNFTLTADCTENSLRETLQALDPWQGLRSQSSREITPRKFSFPHTSSWE